MIYGYLRETKAAAEKAGADKDTGLARTGLEEYLSEIFPEVDDWIHDKELGKSYNGKRLKIRPDYRSESLGLVVEFDGIQHYQNPLRIIGDEENTKTYKALGYKVARIPYFIQLSRKAVRTLFGVDVGFEMFDETIPSLGVNGRCTPAFLCPLGIERMAREFVRFPEQYHANVKALKGGDERKTGLALLQHEYEKAMRLLELEKGDGASAK